jgi:hypothetical protein
MKSVMRHGATAKSLGGADHVPTGCLDHDCLDRNLLCSVCLCSERFSYVVVTGTASPQCPQRRISTGAQLIHVKAIRRAPRYWYFIDPMPMDMLTVPTFRSRCHFNASGQRNRPGQRSAPPSENEV